MTNPRIEFFDNIAFKWDDWIDPAGVRKALRAGLEEFGVEPHEWVVDIGCGTGNLTQCILSGLGPEGRVFAVDFAPKMLEKAKRKISDPRVSWINKDATGLPLEDQSIDRAVFYSVWPHFDNPGGVLVECLRYLKPGGRLHVWHTDSKETINKIHTDAGPAVKKDILPPAGDVAVMIKEIGLEITDLVDDETRYLVTARKKL